MEHTQCQTILRYDENKNPVFKNKLKFKTLEIAIKRCKMENAKDSQIKKLVSYKCSECHQYHIGRGNTIITPKYRAKLKKELSQIKFKVVGKIKL